MEELNTYIYNVFSLIKVVRDKGLLERPIEYKLNKYDRKVLNELYILYKIYNLKINRKIYINLCIEYSLNSNINIIKSGIEVAENIEKIINS